MIAYMLLIATAAATNPVTGCWHHGATPPMLNDKERAWVIEMLQPIAWSAVEISRLSHASTAVRVHLAYN